MALAILGRGSLQGLTASGYALTPRFSPYVVRGCKLPRPKRARAIFGVRGESSSSKCPVIWMLYLTPLFIHSLDYLVLKCLMPHSSVGRV